MFCAKVEKKHPIGCKITCESLGLITQSDQQTKKKISEGQNRNLRFSKQTQ